MVPTAPDAILPAHSTPTPGAPDAVTAAHSAPTPAAPGAVTGAFSTPSPEAPGAVTPAWSAPAIRQAAVAASGLLYIDFIEVNDTVTIGDVVYKFVASPSSAYEVYHGVSALDGIANLVNAINNGTGAGVGTGTVPNPQVTAETVENYMRVSARTAGVAGNLIATTTTIVNAEWPEATLLGGLEQEAPAAITPAHSTPTPSAPTAIVP